MLFQNFYIAQPNGALETEILDVKTAVSVQWPLLLFFCLLLGGVSTVASDGVMDPSSLPYMECAMSLSPSHPWLPLGGSGGVGHVWTRGENVFDEREMML